MEKNEKQAKGLQLTKDSTPAIVKNYFEKILELKQIGKDFPVNLDDAWPLAYSEKGKAVRALKTNFVEDVHYQVLAQNGKNSKGGRPVTEYWLSVPCLEYFIASRVHPVFEVYRKVFHATIEQKQQPKQLSQTASKYQEKTVFAVKMGQIINQIYVIDGVIYAKASPIMKYIGYLNGISTQQIDRIGRQYFVQVKIGLSDVWFINMEGFNNLLQMTTIPVKVSVISNIYHDLYGVEIPDDESPFTYKFTDRDILQIIEEINKKPIHKDKVLSLLLNGKQ
ncbi:MAG: hypothetical protein A2W90_14565 [Bacteroidetes bacterium GWF2_42_66]|nr:MAG: hypothetical protein A2W92_15960 [Bacteroidetes bacterium GWA2_42_15]OFX99082.1 MAG: hypothetical protein A2W89_06695 [Bacteroidetes bacterium GWE2_42_39]OFY46749.1 MAG: hypothetical protein A2W90_14565 [Bacteroidetes bacterium GWF2_42_66]HAZ00696.1 hypothetical protein [Marinilabiliales bacterium]HBL73844.1 hypothetical protein [Prolixibacteraceae bacterium]